MLIRTAISADIPALRALDLASHFGARWSDAHYANFFVAADRLKHLVLATEEQEAIIAYLAASGVGTEWELENIVVATHALRRGIARALLEGLIERLRKEGVERLRLEVRESNAPARALYAKLHFAEEARRKAYYADPVEDAIILSRAL